MSCISGALDIEEAVMAEIPPSLSDKARSLEDEFFFKEDQRLD
jgi:hypothetical protein